MAGASLRQTRLNLALVLPWKQRFRVKDALWEQRNRVLVLRGCGRGRDSDLQCHEHKQKSPGAMFLLSSGLSRCGGAPLRCLAAITRNM